jgi:biopolymer transport protein ExbD
VSRIVTRRPSSSEIPTASTGDIAFLLIIFFLVGTTFRAAQGLKVVLPDAMSTERIIKKRNVQNLWIDKTGRISVSDNLVTVPSVTPILSEKVIENPDLVVVLQADTAT